MARSLQSDVVTCEATALIRGKGKIIVAGTLFTDQGDFRLAVTGGTGRSRTRAGS